jgi:hypothetical protein
MTIYRILPAFAILLVLAGCKTTVSLDPFSSGISYDIASMPLILTVPNGQPVSVAVIDRRPYVLKGKESPRFLGTEQGEKGPPITAKTASGQTMAEDLTQVITAALGRAGVAAEPLAVPDKADDAEVKALYATQGPDRLLLVRILDWRTKAFTRHTAQWRLEAAVYDHSGAELGQAITTGLSPIGTTTMRDNAQVAAVGALNEKLSYLLNDPGVTDALR